jgi:uncharacterized membrane protein YoaK (UPF0700 family)
VTHKQPITGVHTLANGAQPWLYIGGAALAGVAGYVNAACILVTTTTVAHLSGAVSNVAVDLVMPERSAEAWKFFIILVGFFLGATTSGAVVGAATLAPGRRYGVALMVEGVALVLGAKNIATDPIFAIGSLAFAMGLQNAIATMYRGLVLRTTHVTGIVTDLGVMVGHMVRRERVAPWRFVLLLSLGVGFALGGVAGAILFRLMGAKSLWLPAIGTLFGGFVYFLWRARKARSLWSEWRRPRD